MYQESNRIVEFNFEEGHKVITVEHLKEAAANVFGLTCKLKMQKWERMFEDWVDIHDESEVDPASKIKVIQVAASSQNLSISDSTNSSREDSVGSQDDDDDDTVACSEHQEEPVPTASTSNWIALYNLPKFSSHLTEKLKTNATLKEGERSAILEAVYDSVKKYTYYPTSAQYYSLVDMLLQRFPKIADDKDMPLANVKEIWKNRLQYKFANTRKRDDQAMPSVVARKRKAMIKNGEMHSSKKTGPPQWGMVHYKPQRPSSEDDQSIEKHIEWMKDEYKRKKPNYDRVDVCMNASLADRRSLIIDNYATVSNINKTYPWLFDEEEILKEFTRLSEKDLKTILKEGMEKYGKRTVQLAKQAKKQDKLFLAAYQTMSEKRDEQDLKDATSVAAVLGVPGLLREKVGMMVVLDGEEHGEISEGQPMIKGDKSNLEDCTIFTVEADGEVVAECQTLFDGISVYLAVYYIFNLAYPTSLKHTLAFMQKVILNIQDNNKVEKSVLGLLDRINRLKSVLTE